MWALGQKPHDCPASILVSHLLNLLSLICVYVHLCVCMFMFAYAHMRVACLCVYMHLCGAQS